MQHPGHSEIVNETRMCENLIWNIYPRNRFPGKGALGRFLRPRAWLSVAVQRDLPSELPVAGAYIAGSGDCAVFDV